MMGNPENSTRNLFPKQIYRSQCTRLRRSRPVHPAVHTLSIGLSQGAVCSNLRLRPYRIPKISLYIQRCWLNLYLSVSIGHSISIAYCDDDEWRQNVIRANIKASHSSRTDRMGVMQCHMDCPRRRHDDGYNQMAIERLLYLYFTVPR